MTERTWTQRFEVNGEELSDQIKKLYDDASAKREVIRDQEGSELLAVPLTVGVAGGAITVLAAPVLAAVAAIGGVAAKVRLDVERVGEPETPEEADAVEVITEPDETTGPVV